MLDLAAMVDAVGIVAVTALSLGVLGHDEDLHMPSWCWIDPNVHLLSALCWQYITGKAWEITCYFVIVGLYLPVKCKIQRQVRVQDTPRILLYWTDCLSVCLSVTSPCSAFPAARTPALTVPCWFPTAPTV